MQHENPEENGNRQGRKTRIKQLNRIKGALTYIGQCPNCHFALFSSERKRMAVALPLGKGGK